jgi:hypothetical protein
MVRLKNRYLLVNILYPELDVGLSKSRIPDVVAFNQATAQALNPQALLKGLRAEIQSLFGDFGSGAVSDSLSGRSIIFRTWPHCKLTLSSQVSLQRDINLYPTSYTSTLQDRLGGTIYDDSSTNQRWQEVHLPGRQGQWHDAKS